MGHDVLSWLINKLGYTHAILVKNMMEDVTFFLCGSLFFLFTYAYSVSKVRIRHTKNTSAVTITKTKGSGKSFFFVSYPNSESGEFHKLGFTTVLVSILGIMLLPVTPTGSVQYLIHGRVLYWFWIVMMIFLVLLLFMLYLGTHIIIPVGAGPYKSYLAEIWDSLTK